MTTTPGANTIDLDAAAEVLAGVTWTADSDIAVVVATEDSSNTSTFGHLRATAEAANALRALVTNVAKKLQDNEVIEYGPNTTLADGQVMAISVSDVPTLDAIVDATTDTANLELFTPTPERLRQLRLAAIRAEAGDHSAVFVQALGATKIVARSKKISLIITRGQLDVPKQGELVMLGANVEAMVTGGIAFFSDRAAFQRVFGYLEELRAQATETFEDVTKDLNIENRDAMMTAVTSGPMLGKMLSIRSKLAKYPAYRAALTMENLKAFVDTHPECGVQMNGDGKDASFVFTNDPQHRFKILKLLDDDFLRSELTTLEYEANSKGDPIG